MAKSQSVSMLPLNEAAVARTEVDSREGISLIIAHTVLYNFDTSFVEEFELKTVSVETTQVCLYFKLRPGREQGPLTVEVIPTVTTAEAPAINLVRVRRQS